MLSLLHEEIGSASDTVLAPPREGSAAATDRRDDEATPPDQRHTLSVLMAALAATRRGLGD